jgi:hypothetical protein
LKPHLTRRVFPSQGSIGCQGIGKRALYKKKILVSQDDLPFYRGAMTGSRAPVTKRVGFDSGGTAVVRPIIVRISKKEDR